MSQTTVLVVDDDPVINELIKASLEGEGWTIYSAHDGDEAIKLSHEKQPDLIILDIMMPGIDGVEVCRHIASTSSTPIIMLSALGGLNEKTKCLDIGADDYVTKPFQVEELISRAKAVLRRRHRNDNSASKALSLPSDLVIDFMAKRVKVGGQEVRLTPMEFRLLEELATNAGKALTYRYLLNKIWGPEYSDERQYLHVCIGHLRAKMESDPQNPKYIVNVRGIGYRFEDIHSSSVIKGHLAP